jgi:hypothetical protein
MKDFYAVSSFGMVMSADEEWSDVPRPVRLHLSGDVGYG